MRKKEKLKENKSERKWRLINIFKMKKCPNCNRKLYPKDGGGFYCKNCGYVNNPNWREHGKPSNG